jgi:hypothetical protein
VWIRLNQLSFIYRKLRCQRVGLGRRVENGGRQESSHDSRLTSPRGRPRNCIEKICTLDRFRKFVEDVVPFCFSSTGVICFRFSTFQRYT